MPLLKLLTFVLAFFGLALFIQKFGNPDLLKVFATFTVIVPFVYLLVDRFKQKNDLLRSKEQALQAELALLKNQINPHFFFNTLNNLYGLAVAKSDLAPRLILKLSDLMRFTIYEGKKDHVFLRDEITYLENYLEIQRIRQNQVDLRFETEVADDLVEVPPLLFIMLLENALKHGVATLLEAAFVHIRLTATADSICFDIENNFGPVEKKSPGIGLENMERRLALLFPGRHKYTKEIADNIYKASVRLEL